MFLNYVTKLPYKCLLILALSTVGQPLSLANTDLIQQGKSIYDYYCYQCHAYAGNAQTLATAYLSPKPRDFTRHTMTTLPEEKMRDAISHGRAGTAMVSFSSVLNNEEITAVIAYIQHTFMSGKPPAFRYHTKENGWPNHERYRSAFAFVSGEIKIDTPESQLTSAQQHGRNIFLNACVSCHDHTLIDEKPVWQPQPVSYPRNPGIDVTYKNPSDVVTGASPYSAHDQPIKFKDLSHAEQQGQQLFQDNCAFCHAADGTGKNWIGSFMQPPARDLTRSPIISRGDVNAITQIINNGLPNTSMPAWQDVLSEQQKEYIIAYLIRAFGKSNSPAHNNAKTNSISDIGSGRHSLNY